MPNRASRELEHSLNVDMLMFLDTIKDQLSEAVAALRGMAINQVLDTETATIDGTGVWTRDFVVPFASVAIRCTNPVVAATGPPQVAAPTGPASQAVSRGAVFNMSGRELSVYGPAGTQISLQIFAKPCQPSFAEAATVVTAATAQTVTTFAENSAVLAAGGTRNGAAHDTNGLGVARFRAVAASDVAGNLQVQQSDDGVTWFITQPNVGILADFTQGTVLESIITMRYVRAVVTNGGGAPQTSFKFSTALVAI
jgi:hypothetical protein